MDNNLVNDEVIMDEMSSQFNEQSRLCVIYERTVTRGENESY